jgi:FAD/FMN-containing dehydrogenase
MAETYSCVAPSGLYKTSFLVNLPRQFPPGMSVLPEFKQSFKGDIVTPDDEGYTQAIARWAANAERNARVVAFVKDTDDVALALKYARTNNLHVAIRCGGHSPSSASSSEDGLVVDLSRYFDYAVVDPEKRTVRVGNCRK